jgi:hypothetical protein
MRWVQSDVGGWKAAVGKGQALCLGGEEFQIDSG